MVEEQLNDKAGCKEGAIGNARPAASQGYELPGIGTQSRPGGTQDHRILEGSVPSHRIREGSGPSHQRGKCKRLVCWSFT